MAFLLSQAEPPDAARVPARMTESKGKGSAAARHANAVADRDGHKNPRESSKAQAVLGRAGAKAKKKKG